MRRSICVCSPASAFAGEINTWSFVYTTTSQLPKGTRVKFDLASKGRDIDWQLPDEDPKAKENQIYLEVDGHKPIYPTLVETPDSITPQYEFKLPAEIPAGEAFTILVGQPPSKQSTTTNGTAAQTNAQRRRPFLLYVDPSGKGRYDEPEVFTMDVRGGPLATLRVLAPSFVQRNKRFDVTVRFEDEFGNLTSTAPEDTLIELSHEHLRDNLTWKLFVPETGFLTLPNLYFNEAGVYTIRLYNTKTKETFCSPPIKCFQESEASLFWGLLHGESERFDSTESIEPCLRHFRDDRALNFFCASPFESLEETPVDIWKLISQNIIDFNEDDRFNALLGFQWAGTAGEEGVRQFVYAKDNKSILRKKDSKYSTLKKIYKLFQSKEIISIPCFTMGKGFSFNFESHNPDFERVVEIYNAWGSSECTKKEGNPLPITAHGKNGVKEAQEGSIQEALKKNVRVGFVAGGLDDRGIYAELYDSEQEQYVPGLTGVIVGEQSRSAIFESIYNRSCYATTGKRIIITFDIAGTTMGGEIDTQELPGLAVNRHISLSVAGTDKLQKVEIIRCGKVIETVKPDDYWVELTYDDMTALDKACIDNKDKKPPFAYYYIRVTQEDGHMAWSSPIWIDLIQSKSKRSKDQ